MKNGMAVLAGLILVVASVVCGHATDPDSETTIEHQVKAAFVLKFISFIEWPESALPDSARTITIGVLGRGPMDEALGDLQGHVVGGRRILVRHMEGENAKAFSHILFLNRSVGPHGVAEALRILGNAGTLTIADSAGFARMGVMINFVIDHDKVRFEINVNAAKRANLDISSKLLRVARIVEE